MLKTFTATLQNNNLQWTDETPNINPNVPVKVQITLSEETVTNENSSDGKKMADALRKIANNNTLTDINPQIWQQQTRRDRTLPYRD